MGRSDVPDGVCCKFEFTKPGRTYGHLVSQRLFLDFVRNGMKSPQRMSYGIDELRGLMVRTNKRQQLKENMDFDKNMVLLEAAWPQINQQGGLPVNAINVGEDLVFVSLVQARVHCPPLLEVVPPVPAGTKLIIQLQKLADGYIAKPLAIHGRHVELLETAEGQKRIFSPKSVQAQGLMSAPVLKSAEEAMQQVEKENHEDADWPHGFSDDERIIDYEATWNDDNYDNH